MNSMGEKKRRTYDEAFREDAVRLVMESGKSARQVARELGIGGGTLSQWKREYLAKLNPLPGHEMAPTEMFEEIRRLHKEVDYLRRQREILKKAMSILSDGPTSGMP